MKLYYYYPVSLFACRSDTVNIDFRTRHYIRYLHHKNLIIVALLLDNWLGRFIVRVLPCIHFEVWKYKMNFQRSNITLKRRVCYLFTINNKQFNSSYFQLHVIPIRDIHKLKRSLHNYLKNNNNSRIWKKKLSMINWIPF